MFFREIGHPGGRLDPYRDIHVVHRIVQILKEGFILRESDAQADDRPEAHRRVAVVDEFKQVGALALADEVGRRPDLGEVGAVRALALGDLAEGTVFIDDEGDHEGLGQHPEIEDLHPLLYEGGTMRVERGLLRFGHFALEQVHEILWIGLHVIKFLDGTGRCDVGLLGFCQAVAVGRGMTEDLLLDRALVRVDARLCPGEVRQVIADVEIVLAADRTGEVEDLVDPVAEAVDVFGFGRGLGTEENLTLHRLGYVESGEREHGRCEIDEGDEAIDRLPGLCGSEVLVFFGEAHHHRHVHPAVVEESFVPGHARAVIGVEKDDRVVGKALLLELLEDRSDLLVEDADTIVETRQFAPHRLGVGIVGRHRDLRWIVDLLGGQLRLHLFAEDLIGPHHRRGLVGDHVVDHREEGLALLARTAAPRGGRADFVPRLLDEAHLVARVVIGLDLVRREVTGFAQVGGESVD